MFDLNWTPPVLETERLILRPLTIEDALDVFQFCSNPNMTRYTLWDTHRTIDDSLVFINDYPLTRYPSRVPDPLGIVQKLDPAQSVIGTVGCFWVSKKDAVMEIGYNLAEPLWGQGIIVEAARCLIGWVFDNYPVERLQARVLFGNTASGRVARKLGMTYEGTQRSALSVRGKATDVSYYSLLRGERGA